jgi:hypothetical protein
MLTITLLASFAASDLAENFDLERAVDFVKKFQKKIESDSLSEKDFAKFIFAQNYIHEKRREYLEKKHLKERLFPWYMRRGG